MKGRDMNKRKYLPTLSDLVDRMTIIQLKAIFIPEHSKEYVAERKLVEHDIDLILKGLKHCEKSIRSPRWRKAGLQN